MNLLNFNKAEYLMLKSEEEKEGYIKSHKVIADFYAGLAYDEIQYIVSVLKAKDFEDMEKGKAVMVSKKPEHKVEHKEEKVEKVEKEDKKEEKHSKKGKHK